MYFSKMTTTIFILLALLVNAKISYGAEPAESTGGIISQLISHDKHAQLMIRVNGNQYNELAKCDIRDAYILDNRTGGYDSHRALILAAYMSGKVLKFKLKGCVKGNPRIVSVKI